MLADGEEAALLWASPLIQGGDKQLVAGALSAAVSIEPHTPSALPSCAGAGLLRPLRLPSDIGGEEGEEEDGKEELRALLRKLQVGIIGILSFQICSWQFVMAAHKYTSMGAHGRWELCSLMG